MFRIISFIIKATLVTALVLIAGQIPLQTGNTKKKVSEYVDSALHSSVIQTPLNWIATKFDFIEGNANHKRPTQIDDDQDKVSKTEKSSLSGLLKSKK